jgi:diguanylate cyclase (GGDEF)-like protein/PAS domain S-box-containing protein
MSSQAWWILLAVGAIGSGIAARRILALPLLAAARPTRFGLLVAAPLVVIVMAGGLAWLQDTARDRQAGAYAVVDVHESVSALRAHEREAAADHGVLDPQLEHVAEHTLEARLGVAGLGATELPAGDRQAVAQAFDGYVTAARRLMTLFAEGDLEAATAHDYNSVAPAYNELDDTLVRVRERNDATVARVQRLTDVASIATFAVGLLAIVLLLLKFGRAQQAATAAATLRESEARLRALNATSSDVTAVVGDDLRIRWIAASIERVFGYPQDSALGVSVFDLVHPDDAHATVEALGRGGVAPAFRIRHADGHWVDVEAAVADQRRHSLVAGYVVGLRDVTERTHLEARLRHQAFHDHLTGLANRALLEDRLGQALRRAERDGGVVGVVFCDLDDFKDVNDTLGHDVGDELLVAVADRIAGELRATDTLARVGGDEFLLLLDRLGGTEEAETIARRVLAALGRPLRLAGEEHVVRASLGVTVGGCGTDARGLLRDADTAMYAAKRRGGGGYELFVDRMGEEVALRLRLRSELELALRREQFVVHYQPIVALATGRVVGLEALVRWQHPERGIVPPAQFIPLAEQSGLIVPLGAWVLQTACAQVARWREELGREDLYVSVNLASRQLVRPQLADEVACALASAELPASALLLEVTESALIDDVEGSARRLEQLRELGVRLAIDDFGTGYSALSYLREFPMDVLKIDRSFVQDLSGSDRDNALVDAMIKMASSLGLAVVAEGIEHEDQRDRLDALACTHGQGFLFSRPATAAEVGQLIATGGDEEWRSALAPAAMTVA